MAHDFANHRPSRKTSSKRKTPTKAKPKNSTGHWSSYFSGVLTGLFIAFIAYLGLIRTGTPPAQTHTTNTASTTAEEDDEGNFGFYTDFRDAEVVVDVQIVDTAPDETNTPLNYRLQAGSFQKRQDAEQRRANITLLGMSTEIMPGIVSGRTWYRVQVGPFSGRDNTNEARNILSTNNIDTIVSRISAASAIN